jgi:hypothetical protein
VTELEELYDERTLAAVDRGAGEPTPDPWRPAARRRGVGALLTGMALGLCEVLDAELPGDAVVELRPDVDDAAERWVAFVLVPGAPAASRLVVRPWLAPDARNLESPVVVAR